MSEDAVIFTDDERELMQLLSRLDAPEWLNTATGQWLFSCKGMEYPESILSREEEELMARVYRLGCPEELRAEVIRWLHRRHLENAKELLRLDSDLGE